MMEGVNGGERMGRKQLDDDEETENGIGGRRQKNH